MTLCGEWHRLTSAASRVGSGLFAACCSTGSCCGLERRAPIEDALLGLTRFMGSALHLSYPCPSVAGFKTYQQRSAAYPTGTSIALPQGRQIAFCGPDRTG